MTYGREARDIAVLYIYIYVGGGEVGRWVCVCVCVFVLDQVLPSLMRLYTKKT